MPSPEKSWIPTIIAALALVFTISQFGGQFIVPEVRAWLGLRDAKPADTAKTPEIKAPVVSNTPAEPQPIPTGQKPPETETTPQVKQPQAEPEPSQNPAPAPEIDCRPGTSITTCSAPKAGFEFDYPSGQFQRISSQADEMLRLRSESGAIVAVTLVSEPGPGGLEREYQQELTRPGRTVKLRVIRGDAFVVSGWDGPQIFYNRAIAVRNGIVVMRMSHESSINPGIDLVQKVAQTLRAIR